MSLSGYLNSVTVLSSITQAPSRIQALSRFLTVIVFAESDHTSSATVPQHTLDAMSDTWDGDSLTRVRDVTKAFLKKFGPFIITGLAALAEHRWLDHDDNSEEDLRPRERSDESDHKHHPVEKLEHEVSEIKKSLSYKVKDVVAENEEKPYLRIKEETVRKRIPKFRREERWQDGSRGKPAPEASSGKGQRYEEYQVTETTRREIDPSNRSTRFREREAFRSTQHRAIQHPRRHRRHRSSSVSTDTSHDDRCSEKTIHAGKVAAVAGFVEALHVSNSSGDWVGPKGVRVGTTMAASFAASHLRDEEDTRAGLGPAVDVGAGLLVSEVVHGSSRKFGR